MMAKDGMCQESIDHFKKQMEFMTDQKTKAFEMYYDKSRFDSPIEEILFAELCIQQIFQRWPTRIYHQVQEGPYRIDIATEYEFNEKVYRVAIECDGHDYHEHTEKQARRDKTKDRFLQSQGWLIARFTGKQITNDPVKCVEEILDMLITIDINNNR